MIANHKGELPFFLLLIPFMLGIGLAYAFPFDEFGNWLVASFAAVSIVFISLNLAYKQFNLHKFRWIGGLFIAVILFLAGSICLINNNELNNKNHFSKAPAQYLIGHINNEPVLKNGWVRFTVNVEGNINNGKTTTSSGNLLIALKSTDSKLYYGDVLLIPAKYTTVNQPFNPAEFNYKRYLANQNIHFQEFLFPGQYRVLAKDKGNAIISYSLKLRQAFVEKLKHNMRDTDAIAVASTLILGYKADLSNDVLQAYSKTGTVHVLSVSGAHVGIVYLLLSFTLGFLNRFKYGKLLKSIIIITLIWYYSMLTGFSAPVCRAALMLSLFIIGKTYNRYINSLNILAVSAFALLLYNPLYLTDVGFQLSYLAVFGLIVFQPVVYNLVKLKNKWIEKLWAITSVSIAAQVITFPLSAFYFHQFPVYFLVSNIFIIVPTAVIMYSGIALLLLPQIPYLSRAIAFVLERSILLMNKGLTWVQHLPVATISKIWLTAIEHLLLYVIIICLFYFLYDKKFRRIQLAAICSLILCISFGIKRIRSVQTNNIAWLNVNKHKAIVFKSGDNGIVVTDLKDTDKVYRYAIQPYLDSSRTGNVKIIGLNQNCKTESFIKKDGLIQFRDKKIYLINTQLEEMALQPKIKTDFVYITSNPHTGISAINHSFDYNLLIIDGSNSNAYINRLSEEAGRENTNYKILKRNISLITVSN
ncbi:MAG TPA: ComEC/Rec2 family competence protein [Mucilaginibacter sp.]